MRCRGASRWRCSTTWWPRHRSPVSGAEHVPLAAAARAAALSLLVCGAAVCAQDTLLARNLAAVCANCHGTEGQARGSLIKPLAGMPADKLVAAMAGFRSGTLPATVMHQIAQGFSDDQVKAIAAYYAVQPTRP